MNQIDNMKNVNNSKENNLQADVVIVGTGVGGCFSALNLSEDLSIIMITKSDLESSDSFLARRQFLECALHDATFHSCMRMALSTRGKELLVTQLFCRRYLGNAGSASITAHQ